MGKLAPFFFIENLRTFVAKVLFHFFIAKKLFKLIFYNKKVSFKGIKLVFSFLFTELSYVFLIGARFHEMEQARLR